jgi:hypothetical protein
MTKARSKSRKTVSRREVLLGMATAGAGVAACSLCGLGGGLLLATPLRRALLHPTASQTPRPTATPQPTATPLPPPMVLRAEWGASEPDHNAENEHGFYSAANPEGWRVYDTPLEHTYQTLILHHSAFYERDDLDTMLEVQRAHRQDRGWADVGYHFMVGKTGTIFEGRDLQVRGTHVEGHNTGSLGICLLGNMTWDVPTEAQVNATQRLVGWLVKKVNPGCIATHRDFNPLTYCPGDDIQNFSQALAGVFGLTQGIGCYIAPPEAEAISACTCGNRHV